MGKQRSDISGHLVVSRYSCFWFYLIFSNSADVVVVISCGDFQLDSNSLSEWKINFPLLYQ